MTKTTHETFENLMLSFHKLEQRIEVLEEKIIADQAKRDLILTKCSELMHMLMEENNKRVKPKKYIHGNNYEQ